MKIATYRVHLGDYCQVIRIINDETKSTYNIEFSFTQLDNKLVEILKEQEINRLFLFAPKVIKDHIKQLIRKAELKVEII